MHALLIECEKTVLFLSFLYPTFYKTDPKVDEHGTGFTEWREEHLYNMKKMRDSSVLIMESCFYNVNNDNIIMYIFVQHHCCHLASRQLSFYLRY